MTRQGRCEADWSLRSQIPLHAGTLQQAQIAGRVCACDHALDRRPFHRGCFSRIGRSEPSSPAPETARASHAVFLHRGDPCIPHLRRADSCAGICKHNAGFTRWGRRGIGEPPWRPARPSTARKSSRGRRPRKSSSSRTSCPSWSRVYGPGGNAAAARGPRMSKRKTRCSSSKALKRPCPHMCKFDPSEFAEDEQRAVRPARSVHSELPTPMIFKGRHSGPPETCAINRRARTPGMPAGFREFSRFHRGPGGARVFR